jgi:hypothetical protein
MKSPSGAEVEVYQLGANLVAKKLNEPVPVSLDLNRNFQASTSPP